MRNGPGGGRRLPAAGGHRRVRQPGKGDQRAPSGGSAVRRIRRQQRHSHLPRRCRRHRGPGLDRDALPYVYPLGRAPRLHLSADGLRGRRRGGHQVRHHPHRGRQRLWLPQERKRRPPAGPGVPLRRQRPAADQLCCRGGHARAGRRQRDRDPPRGHRNAGLPLQRRRRPAHQQDLLRRPPDPPAHRHRGVLPDGAQPVPEP